jgi:hypothetical protein
MNKLNDSTSESIELLHRYPSQSPPFRHGRATWPKTRNLGLTLDRRTSSLF